MSFLKTQSFSPTSGGNLQVSIFSDHGDSCGRRYFPLLKGEDWGEKERIGVRSPFARPPLAKPRS